MLVVIVDREAIVVREDRVVAGLVAAVVVVEVVAAAVVDAAVLVADRAADARSSTSKK